MADESVELSKQPDSVCLNCDTPLVGKFCSTCGQKRIDAKDRTLLYFFKQFFESAFFLENSFINNLWRLLISPGLQANDFVQGRRRRWMSPFSIFFLINLIYFIVNPLTDFNLPLDNHLRYHATTYSGMAIRMVEKRMEARQVTFKEYAQKFDQETIDYSKALMVLNVPVLSLFLAIIFVRQKRFFTDHFIYALYLFSFVLLWACIWVLTLNILRWAGLPHIQILLPIGLVVMIIFHLIQSLKRFYWVKRWWALTIISAVLTGVFFITVLFYRFLIFMVTFLMT